MNRIIHHRRVGTALLPDGLISRYLSVSICVGNGVFVQLTLDAMAELFHNRALQTGLSMSLNVESGPGNGGTGWGIAGAAPLRLQVRQGDRLRRHLSKERPQ